MREQIIQIVMAGLDPAIQPFFERWIAGSTLAVALGDRSPGNDDETGGALAVSVIPGRERSERARNP
jgi:hypothetical protein